MFPKAAAFAIALAALAVTVVLLARGGAPGEGRIGYSTHLAFAGDPGPDLERLHDAGVAWIREDFLWERWLFIRRRLATRIGLGLLSGQGFDLVRR